MRAERPECYRFSDHVLSVNDDLSNADRARRDVAAVNAESSCSADAVITAIDELDRQIDVLAKALGVLGHFGEDDDRPRAA